MNERMTDARMFGTPTTTRDELHRALLAERVEVERLERRVVRLEAALTDLREYALHPGELVPTSLRIERFYAALDEAAAVLAEGATT